MPTTPKIKKSLLPDKCKISLHRDVQIMYIPSNKTPVSREKLRVNISKDFNRLRLPDEYENEIHNIWKVRTAANPTLWNGSKFRIESVVEDEKNDEVTFNIGITSYRDFIGTNWAPNAKQYQDLGLNHSKNSQVFMSDALGVGSLVITADDQVILLRRSQHLAEAAGLWDIPGGHPEPKELVASIEADEINLLDLKPDAVRDEIFNSMLSEIVYEVNIPREHLSDPLLIGIARNTTSAGRPSSEYIVRCSMNSEEILKKYKEGTHEEVGESTGLLFVPLNLIQDLQNLRPEIWAEPAPSAKGCFTLYCMLYGDSC